MKLNIKFIFYAIFLILFQVNVSGSDLILKWGNKTSKINSVNIRGAEYVSTKELSKALNANYYFNSNRKKSEIKFKNYKLKFTANNQFVILTNKKSSKHQIFQFPLAARLRNNDIYIPIKYSVKYLEYASELQSTYSASNNSLVILSQKVETKELIKWNETLVDLASVKYDVFSAKIENKSNGTLLRLSTKRKIRKPASSISNNTLYVFFSDVTFNINEINKLKSKGFITSIKIKHVNGNPQLELKLKPGYDKHEVFYDDEIGEILVSIHNKYLKNESNSVEELEKWKFDVIVIDPGHGGKDPGAIGLNGVKEKDINLAIAKELGSIIEKSDKSIKVVYTRETDKFVELFKRGKIANDHEGNLFVSIHCNSTPKKPSSANGFEVYLLRPGRTKEAIDIAEFENSVIRLEDDPSRYKKLNDENFILVSMAHASYMRYSESFADMLNTEWIKNVGIPSRGIKQAGFYVLVGASMPGILIESGFLSNKNDIKYLNSKNGQKEIAKSIFAAILKYRNYYESTLNTELTN